jgi:hypothetical protein
MGVAAMVARTEEQTKKQLLGWSLLALNTGLLALCLAAASPQGTAYLVSSGLMHLAIKLLPLATLLWLHASITLSHQLHPFTARTYRNLRIGLMYLFVPAVSFLMPIGHPAVLPWTLAMWAATAFRLSRTKSAAAS